MRDLSLYDPVWRAAEPYMRARKNDVHIPLSFAWCQKLLALHPGADADICSLAILLHDIGWYSIDMERILTEGFRSENFLTSDVRVLHEIEGVRLGTEVLKATGWSEDVIAQVCEIIDGHDTRSTPHHLNDRIVRDSDKLWRYEVTGISVAADWFGTTPGGYADRIEGELHKFETDHGRRMAEEALDISRAQLMLHVL
ncbi:HD domain-containing protein [Mesobacterium pallidum]|uniref:HD domain-containing protein n=1 Tax=Mesobacterium pallidum TaxID=2872037 RepID=UPI001EE2343D|nr:HD domain-containing protein [Mesobacterium pallidum]